VGLAGQVRVGGDLPSGQVDRWKAGPDLLDRLVAGDRAQRGNEVLGVQQVPQPLGAEPGKRVILLYRAAQPYNVPGGVVALVAPPAGGRRPVAGQAGTLLGEAGAPVSV